MEALKGSRADLATSPSSHLFGYPHQLCQQFSSFVTASPRLPSAWPEGTRTDSIQHSTSRCSDPQHLHSMHTGCCVFVGGCPPIVNFRSCAHMCACTRSGAPLDDVCVPIVRRTSSIASVGDALFCVGLFFFSLPICPQGMCV